ncbi:MAG: UDP-N-acetylmuramoyl-L-alanyl-D-glutamate--2,6-diaminopimelate ligase [Pseudomonadota bacterium]
MKQNLSILHWSLKDLLSEWASVSKDDDLYVTGISEYSGDVSKGDLFIANSGTQYCDEAISNGAVAILYDSRMKAEFSGSDYSVPQFSIDNLDSNSGKLIQRFYKQGINQIKTVAITGTDGKTSVAHLTAQALEYTGHSCGLIGTLGYGQIPSLSSSTHTTPPPSRLAKEYHQLEERGCDVVAVEASSHGIVQNRLNNIDIHTAVLTNITRDHLDYHQTIEAYIKAKAKLFFEHHPKFAVLNLDDPNGQNWCAELQHRCQVISYSFNNANADVYLKAISYLEDGVKLRLSINNSEYKATVPLLGKFNVMNLLAVVSILLSLNINHQEIIHAIEHVHAVPGRMQIANSDQNISVVIDFAHTPSALASAISAMRSHFNGNLICVFGCGGDRDKGKRPEMGDIATRLADRVVITSDNPRHEDPRVIAEDILKGCKDAQNFYVVLDRRKAIAYALKIAENNDAVLIAGKGHEKTQQIGDQIISFDDVVAVNEELVRIAHG